MKPTMLNGGRAHSVQDTFGPSTFCPVTGFCSCCTHFIKELSSVESFREKSFCERCTTRTFLKKIVFKDA